MHGVSSGSSPVAGFDVVAVGPAGFATREIVIIWYAGVISFYVVYILEHYISHDDMSMLYLL